MDTLRADFVGIGGDPRVRTPSIDRLFRSGVQFCCAFSPSPATLPSHTSMLTGAWPTRHAVPRNSFRVPDALLTLPEILGDAGFATGAFVSSVALDTTFNLAQGFDVYDFRPTRHPVQELEGDQPWRPAPQTLDLATRWWNETVGRRFLWVHVFEPHFPYEPPAPHAVLYDPEYRGDQGGSMSEIYEIWEHPGDLASRDRDHLIALYRAEVAALDRDLEGFLRLLDVEPSTAVVLVSDHGESFGENGLDFKHGPHVFPSDVSVPLAVRGGPMERELSGAIVRTIDIAPTLLSLLGVEAELPPECVDVAGPGARQDLPAFAVATMPWNEALPTGFRNRRLMRVARSRDVACVQVPWSQAEYWFDRRTDPAEVAPLRSAPADAAPLRDALEEWIAAAADTEGEPVDEHLREALRSIGYLD